MKMLGFASVIAGGLIAVTLGFAGPTQAAVNPGPAGPHYGVDNQDEANTSNGFVDGAF